MAGRNDLSVRLLTCVTALLLGCAEYACLKSKNHIQALMESALYGMAYAAEKQLKDACKATTAEEHAVAVTARRHSGQ